MPRKALIIILSIVGVLVIAGGVVLGLVLTKGVQPNQPEFVEKDLGACVVVSRESLAQSLQSANLTAGEPQNQGYAFDPDGEKQICKYDTSKDGQVTGNFSTNLVVFDSTDKKDAALARFGELKSVAGIGQSAYFDAVSVEKSDEAPALNLYRLHVFNDQKLYEFVLQQEPGKDPFTESSASSALQGIAQSASL